MPEQQVSRERPPPVQPGRGEEQRDGHRQHDAVGGPLARGHEHGVVPVQPTSEQLHGLAPLGQEGPRRLLARRPQSGDRRWNRHRGHDPRRQLQEVRRPAVASGVGRLRRRGHGCVGDVPTRLRSGAGEPHPPVACAPDHGGRQAGGHDPEGCPDHCVHRCLPQPDERRAHVPCLLLPNRRRQRPEGRILPAGGVLRDRVGTYRRPRCVLGPARPTVRPGRVGP